MNFGIIGCSRVARRRFLPAIRSSSAARLVFIGSRDSERASEYAREFGAPRAGSYEEVLSDEAVDVVYISTPPLLHTQWVLEAAQAGKHIIVEKPAFPTLAEARTAIAVCRKAGVRLFENYAFLYHPQHESARALLNDVGGLQRLEARYLYPFPPAGDIRFQSALGGGVYHDSFGYIFALALRYFGKSPQSVSCMQTFDAASGIDTAADVILRFSENRTLHGMVQIGSEEYVSSYVLHGPSGSIEVRRAFAVDADKTSEIIVHRGNDKKTIVVPPASQFQLALEDFCAVVMGENARDFEGELLARAAMRESAREVSTKKESASRVH